MENLKEQYDNNLEIGSQKWFKNRARSVLEYNKKENHWDFSDSLCTWSPAVADLYKKMQQEKEYKESVTSEEHEFIKSISDQVVEDIGEIELYIDLGPGTERKEDYFINKIIQKNSNLIYSPVDVNTKMLRDSASYHSSNLEVKPIHSSFENANKKIKSLSEKRLVSLGLTYINYKPKEIHKVLKSTASNEGWSFINIQDRNKVDISKVKKAYVKKDTFAEKMLAEKMKLLNLDLSDYEIEADNVINIWAKINSPSKTLKEKGVKSGDRMKIFRTARYDVNKVRSLLKEDFSVVNQYDIDESSFVGFSVKK